MSDKTKSLSSDCERTIIMTKEYKYKKRCKECSVVTVSNTIPLENGEPCGSCVELDCVTEDSVLTDYWKPFPDSA